MERRGKEREDEGSVKEGGRVLLFHYYSPTPPLLCSPDYAVAEGVEHISIACMVLALQTQGSEISNLLATKCLKIN